VTAADHLTENDIVDAVCCYLRGRGYEIIEQRPTSQRGHPDVLARKDDRDPLLHVEARGATSARTGSPRFGAAFKSDPARSHVARAFYDAAAAEARSGDRREIRSAIALPANRQHETAVEPIRGPLRRLLIGVFWVASGDAVRLDAPWSL
jgi:hypothetical protein